MYLSLVIILNECFYFAIRVVVVMYLVPDLMTFLISWVDPSHITARIVIMHLARRSFVYSVLS